MITDEYIYRQLNKAEVLGLEHYRIGNEDTKEYMYIVRHNMNGRNDVVIYIPSNVKAVKISGYTYCSLCNVIWDICRLNPTYIKVIGGYGLENIHGLFSSLWVAEINVEEFITSNVLDMSRLFYGSTSRIVGIEKLDTHKVWNMGAMFAEYRNNTYVLDLSGLDTSRVTTMNRMFSLSICKVEGIDKLNTEMLRVADNMFSDASIDTHIDISRFKLNNLKSATEMFYNAHVKSINASNLDFSKVECTNIFSNMKIKETSNFDGTTF